MPVTSPQLWMGPRATHRAGNRRPRAPAAPGRGWATALGVDPARLPASPRPWALSQCTHKRVSAHAWCVCKSLTRPAVCARGHLRQLDIPPPRAACGVQCPSRGGADRALRGAGPAHSHTASPGGAAVGLDVDPEGLWGFRTVLHRQTK